MADNLHVEDAADQWAIVGALENQLRDGTRELVANRVYKWFLRVWKGALTTDPKKIEAEDYYDGKLVLRANVDLPVTEVAAQYKPRLLVEQLVRTAKYVLEAQGVSSYQRCRAAAPFQERTAEV